jgi:hypothetical protein
MSVVRVRPDGVLRYHRDRFDLKWARICVSAKLNAVLTDDVIE